MYVKILFVFIIAVLSGFFYIHYLNPGAVTIAVSEQYSYTLPVTAFIFAAFFVGVVLAVINSLIVDTKKAIIEAGARRRRRRSWGGRFWSRVCLLRLGLLLVLLKLFCRWRI